MVKTSHLYLGRLLLCLVHHVSAVHPLDGDEVRDGVLRVPPAVETGKIFFLLPVLANIFPTCPDRPPRSNTRCPAPRCPAHSRCSRRWSPSCSTRNQDLAHQTIGNSYWSLDSNQTIYERVAVGRKYPCSRPLWICLLWLLLQSLFHVQLGWNFNTKQPLYVQPFRLWPDENPLAWSGAIHHKKMQ